MHEPKFVMSEYANKLALLEHKATHYQNECARLFNALEVMYEAFCWSSESEGQDEANALAKSIIDEYNKWIIDENIE